MRAKRSTLPPRRKFQPWVGEENLFLIIVSVLGHLKEIGGGGGGGNFQFPPWGRYGQITH